MLVKVRVVILRIGNLKKILLEKKCITLQTDFGPLHMLTIDSSTLCTADIEQGQLVTVGVVWVVAASLVLWTGGREFTKNI